MGDEEEDKKKKKKKTVSDSNCDLARCWTNNGHGLPVNKNNCD